MSRVAPRRRERAAAERRLALTGSASAWLRVSSAPELRRQARRVALGVTVISLLLYVLAAAAADLIVLHHLASATDARLADRLRVLRVEPARVGSPRAGDPDDAPVFAWEVPAPGRRAVALSVGGPALRGAALAAAFGPARSAPVPARVAGRTFLLLSGTSSSGGLVVVGTSTQQLSNGRTDLLVGEGAVLPVTLLAFFLVADLIGRRAAAPVELARRQQLEFTADASHELRTPLSVIEAEVGLALLTERDAASYKAALQRVEGEARRLAGIVEDLMLLARADALPAQPDLEPVALAPVVRACAERFATVLARSGGTLTVDAEAGDPPPAARLPAEWLDRLVSVLVDNACRYAGQGGSVLVEVDCEAGWALLRVQDSGPGIPAAQRDSVLRRFHRASSSPGGAGLGLSIAHAIVAASGGRITIGTSDLGGACVEVSWPLQLAPVSL